MNSVNSSIFRQLSFELKSVDNKYFELVNFISGLLPLQPESIQSMDDLKNHIQRLSDNSLELPPNLIHYVKNLIFHQFPKKEDCLREIVSNAYDAHYRAGCQNKPVSLTIENGVLTLEDHAGMNWSSLIPLMVPGRSTNPEAIFDIKEGIPNVTGRFGQGALSVFSLISPEPSSLTCRPSFLIDGDLVKLCIHFYLGVEKAPYQVTFNITMENGSVEGRWEQINKISKHVSFHTRLGYDFFKLFAFQGKETVQCDILEEPKINEGTVIGIQSPYLKEKEAQIISYLTEVFKNTTLPFFINGRFVNERPSKTLQMEGAKLYVSPSNKSVLRICEGGKLIEKFPVEYGSFPIEATIDFEKLLLSHDRSEIDYKDQKNLKIVESLLQGIFQSKDLTLQEKEALLNAFYPIIGLKKFNLMEVISGLIGSSEIPCLPLGDELQTVRGEGSIGLNSNFFQALPYQSFFEDIGYKIYFLPEATIKSCSAIKMNGDLHLFLNEKFACSDPEKMHYNLELLNQWLKNKGFEETIDTDKILSNHLYKKESEQGRERCSVSSSLKLDWEKYETLNEEKNTPEILASLFFPNNIKLQEGLRAYLLAEKISGLKKGFSFFGNALKRQYQAAKESFQQINPQSLDYFNSHISKEEKKFLRSLVSCKDASEVAYQIDLYHYFEKKSASLPVITMMGSLYQSAKEKGLSTGGHHFDKRPANLKQCHPYLEEVLEAFKGYPTQWLDTFSTIDTFFMHSATRDEEGLIHLNREFYSKFCQFMEIMEECGLSDISKVCKQSFPNETLKEYTLNDLEIIKKIVQAHPQHTRIKIFTAFARGLIWNLEFFEKLSGHEIHRFFDLFPYKFLGNHSVSLINGKLSVEDYELFLAISQMPHPLESKRLTVEICAKLARIRNRHPFLKLQSVSELLLTSIQEGALDNETLEDISKKIEKFSSAAEYCMYDRRNTAKKIMNFLQEGNQPTFEEMIAYCEKNNCKLLPNLTMEETIRFITKESYYQEIENFDALKTLYQELWEKTGFITSSTRPTIYALLAQDAKNFLTENLKNPFEFDPEKLHLLHEDEEVLKELHDAEYAQRRIQSAMSQSLRENDFISEFCKNAKEAGAKEVLFEMHLTDEGATALVVKDDGLGMDEEELICLKIPNLTKKLMNQEDPNFGWGFYTVFKDYPKVTVFTSKDGRTQHCLHLEKTDKGIVTQIYKKEKPCSIGTTFLLVKEKNGNPLMNFIKTKAELVSKCQFYDGIDIQFQKQSLSQLGKPPVFHEESDGELTIQIGKGEEGIYCNDIRMGSLPLSFTSFLPKELKKLIKENELAFRLFVSNSKQNMNRNHLNNETEVEDQAKALILTSLLHFSLNTLGQKGTINKRAIMNTLSDDFWKDFRIDVSEDESVQSLLAAIEKKEWKFDPNAHKKNSIVEAAKQFFSQIENLSFESDLTIEEFIHSIIEKDQNEQQKTAYQTFCNSFLTSAEFAKIIMNAPLSEEDEEMTLTVVRKEVKEVLTENQILLNSGSYNLDYIHSMNDDELNCLIKDSLESLEDDLMCPSSVIDFFHQKIKDKIKSIKNQQAIHLSGKSYVDFFPLIKEFCKAVSIKVDYPIDIEFHSKPDGSQAHTYRDSKTLFANEFGIVKEFGEAWEFLSTHQIADTKTMKKIASIIETTLHEIVHMEENKSCEGTHDSQFKNNLAQLLERLLIERESEEETALDLIKKSTDSQSIFILKDTDSRK
ncbi:MAG: ATP-binding protein [Parachlamydia sp.]|jgi:hypothetical protein|nr:ATP-binding protein [Parachlamydia sp.]